MAQRADDTGMVSIRSLRRMRVSHSTTLLVSPFFFPERISTGKYNTTLAVEMVARFGAMEVLCAHPFYPEWTPAESNATPPEVSVTRGGAWVRYPRSNVTRRLLLELWFAFFAAKQLWQRRHQIDNIIMVFPPVGFALIAHALLPAHVRKVGIVHDLLGVMARSKDSLVRRSVAKLMARVERRAFFTCDDLVCLSSSMRNLMSRDYGIDANDTAVFYPFATVPAKTPNAQPPAILDTLKKNIVYSGALGEKQTPELLFNVMNALAKRRSDVVCHIFSAGPIFERLRRNRQRSGRFLFHGLVEETDLPKLYADSFVQIVPQAENTGEGAFPSKYPNLVSSGTPIFAICDENSELDKLIHKTACARSTNNRNETEILVELMHFIDELYDSGSDDCRCKNESLVAQLFDVGGLVEFLGERLNLEPVSDEGCL
jgi:glycosyltransferase involved in cell wall biosynthesis